MKIIIGVPATKEDFYPRAREVQRIYRSLGDGNNIYLSAPRRVGKTSIMHHLQDNPAQGYSFILGDYEACKTSDEFFASLVNTLFNNPANAKKGPKFIAKLKDFAKRFESMSFEGLGFKFEAKMNAPIDWTIKMPQILEALQSKDERLVIMMDEFPQVVLNILENQGKAEAENFLLQHRQLRQSMQTHKRISFIYTGSISLNHVVLKAADLKTVNDFDFVHVDPLGRDEAIDMAQQILRENNIHLTAPQLAALIDRLEWLIPYHLQLMLKEIREMHPTIDTTDPTNIVDRAFENLLQIQNKPNFDHYFSRIQRVFQDAEREFVHQVLQLTASQPTTYAMLANEASVLAILPRCADILETLEIDGYLVQDHTTSTYRFRSPLLKAWWLRHESKKYK